MIQFQNLIYVIDQLQVRYFNSLRYKEKALMLRIRAFSLLCTLPEDRKERSDEQSSYPTN